MIAWRRFAVAPHVALGTECVVQSASDEAAAGLAGDAAGGVVVGAGVAALAPRVVAQALDDGAGLVGEDGDGAEMVLVEVARGDRLVAVLDVHADQAAGGDEIVGPEHRPAGAGELLGAAQVERGAARRRLLEALVLGVVEKPMVVVPRVMEVGLL